MAIPNPPLADVQEAERLIDDMNQADEGAEPGLVREWVKQVRGLRDAILVLSHAKEQGEKELEELKKKIMRDQPRDAASNGEASACSNQPESDKEPLRGWCPVCRISFDPSESRCPSWDADHEETSDDATAFRNTPEPDEARKAKRG